MCVRFSAPCSRCESVWCIYASMHVCWLVCKHLVHTSCIVCVQLLAVQRTVSACCVTSIDTQSACLRIHLYSSVRVCACVYLCVCARRGLYVPLEHLTAQMNQTELNMKLMSDLTALLLFTLPSNWRSFVRRHTHTHTHTLTAIISVCGKPPRLRGPFSWNHVFLSLSPRLIVFSMPPPLPLLRRHRPDQRL